MPLVGSHQQGAFSTPTNGQPTDASVVLSNDNANRTTTNAHDADATIHIQSSVLASRPAAGTAQRVWITSDGLRFYFDSGSVWNELDYLSKTAGGTVAGAVTLSASLTAAAASFSGAVTMSGTVTLVGAPAMQYGTGALTIVGGTTGTTIANNANSAPNLALTDAGAATFRNTVTISAGGLTVSSGTTAVQALTATTANITGAIQLADAQQVQWAGSNNALRFTGTTFQLYPNGVLGFSVATGGVGVFTGGVTISAGGLAVTGNSTITGTLGGITTLTATTLAGTLSTAAQPNITSVGVLASTHLTSPVVDSGGLTVTAGDVLISSGVVKSSAQGMFGPTNGGGSVGYLGVSSDTASTATGGASTLPANPSGFLVWKNGATTIKVPYYNA